MLIGGLQKFSLLDYPGNISAIVFTQGCNFRCRFCYNPMLVWPTRDGKSKYEGMPATSQEGRESSFISSPVAGNPTKDHPKIQEDDLLMFLRDRHDKLSAVVITGGEPTIHTDLPRFIKKIKELGYLIKLDTNGTNPEMVQDLINEKLIDYIAMDIKAPFFKYNTVIGVETDLDKIKKSINIIIESGLDHEFRTTIAPKLLDIDDIKEIGRNIKGASKWFLQQFRNDTDLVDNEFKGSAPYSEIILREMCNVGKKYVEYCEIR